MIFWVRTLLQTVNGASSHVEQGGDEGTCCGKTHGCSNKSVLNHD